MGIGGRRVTRERKAFVTSTGQPFRIPRDVIVSLGNGDLPAGYAALCDTFGFHPMAAGIGIIPAETVQTLGNGNALAGRKVLSAFIRKVRRERRKDKGTHAAPV